MLLGIDHLVVAVPDLDTAIRSYTELGFTVVPGGRHPVGTHNALISFADGSYVELIAFYEPSPGHRWWAPLQKGGGLVDFCMQTDDLRGDTAAFRQAGVAIDDPKPLSRARPDGYKLSWVLSIPRDAQRGVAWRISLPRTNLSAPFRGTHLLFRRRSMCRARAPLIRGDNLSPLLVRIRVWFPTTRQSHVLTMLIRPRGLLSTLIRGADLRFPFISARRTF